MVIQWIPFVCVVQLGGESGPYFCQIGCGLLVVQISCVSRYEHTVIILIFSFEPN